MANDNLNCQIAGRFSRIYLRAIHIVPCAFRTNIFFYLESTQVQYQSHYFHFHHPFKSDFVSFANVVKYFPISYQNSFCPPLIAITGANYRATTTTKHQAHTPRQSFVYRIQSNETKRFLITYITYTHYAKTAPNKLKYQKLAFRLQCVKRKHFVKYSSTHERSFSKFIRTHTNNNVERQWENPERL